MPANHLARWTATCLAAMEVHEATCNINGHLAAPLVPLQPLRGILVVEITVERAVRDIFHDQGCVTRRQHRACATKGLAHQNKTLCSPKEDAVPQLHHSHPCLLVRAGHQIQVRRLAENVYCTCTSIAQHSSWDVEADLQISRGALRVGPSEQGLFSKISKQGAGVRQTEKLLP